MSKYVLQTLQVQRHQYCTICMYMSWDIAQIHSPPMATHIVKLFTYHPSIYIYYMTLYMCYTVPSYSDALPTPRPIQVTEASTRLQYQVAGEFNSTGQNLIGGLHVTRFGVPMVVVYTRVSQSVVVVQSVVPGARYDIAVWGVSVDNTRRSGEPSQQTVVVEERSKLAECSWNVNICGRG